MNLEEAINQLRTVKEIAIVPIRTAIEIVLSEIDRLQEENEKLDCIVTHKLIGEPKEITLREGLELIQKECHEHEKCKECATFKEFCMFGNWACKWDIDNIIKAVEKLKEEGE